MRHWFWGIGALMLTLCLSGIGAVVFARSIHPASDPPPAGTWTQKLQGYHVLSLVSAPSNPNILYACVVNQDGRVQLLRSNDFGDNWQNKTVLTTLRGDCQVAVSVVHANTVYGIGKQQGTLLSSHDGGKTWHTLHPVVDIPGQKKPLAWSAGQLSTATGALFSVQFLSIKKFTALRLLRSSDSGNSWMVVDGHFAQTKRGERDYAVNQQDPNTLYELVGKAGSQGDLYRTTDGGQSWGNPVLRGLARGTKVSVAGGRPNVVVVTEPGSGGMQLQVTTDGGGSWNPVPPLTSLQNWLLAPNGIVYASAIVAPTASITPTPAGTTPTPTVTCSISPSPTPPTTPTATTDSSTEDGILLGASSDWSAKGISDRRSLVAPADPQLTIEDFDPAGGQTGQWKNVVQAPTAGALLLVAPGPDNQTLLWFLSSGGALSRTEL